MSWKFERDAAGNPVRGYWQHDYVAKSLVSPTYNEWRRDDMIRRLNGRPITA